MSEPFNGEPTVAVPATRRHRRLFVIIAAVVVALAVIGGTAWTLSSGGTTRATAGPLPGATASKPAKSRAVRGAIVAESGSTWTVRTKAGESVTVTLTAKTRYGTPKQPATQTDFPVGATVVVTGTMTDSTITAQRIAAPAPSPAPSTS